LGVWKGGTGRRVHPRGVRKKEGEKMTKKKKPKSKGRQRGENVLSSPQGGKIKCTRAIGNAVLTPKTFI